MYVIVKDRDGMCSFELDEKEEITYDGIRIYKSRGGFYFDLKDGWRFADGTKAKKAEVRGYTVRNEGRYYERKILVYKNRMGIDDCTFYGHKDLEISDRKSAQIVTHDPYLKGKILLLKEGIIKTDMDVFVDRKRYEGQKLKEGNTVEVNGLRFIYYERFLFLNHFQCEIRLERYPIQERTVVYPSSETGSGSSLRIRESSLVIPKIEVYSPPEPIKTETFLRSFLPNMIMAILIAVMGYLNYLNSPNAGWNYLLMPAGMIVTGIVLPLSFHLGDRIRYHKESHKRKAEYQTYLERYETDLEASIDRYVKDQDRFFFDSPEGKEPFRIRQGQKGILLSLGRKQISEKIEWKKTDDRQLDEILQRIEHRLLHIDDIPVFLDLEKYARIGIVSKDNLRPLLMKRFILELSYRYHFEELSIAIYCKDRDLVSEMYDLPHLFQHGKRMTFHSANQLQELDRIRLDHPMILFLYDHCSCRFNDPLIRIVCFAKEEGELYRDCEAVVTCQENNRGIIHTEDDREPFFYLWHSIDTASSFRQLGRYNRSFVKEETRSFRTLFPDHDIGKMYERCDGSLKAEFAYCDREILSFDLHEKKQGPHGLIAGSTGSGKSELIVSMLLSLCLRYSPDYLNIVLIDYKGGGIRESLSVKGRMVPHVVASVTNLENNRFERLIIALNHECIRRQKEFTRLSAAVGIAIADIDDYRAYSAEDRMAHLLIVVDEFAELKKENPLLIRELISLSRIGRSLGLHLILATQKPSGNIDEEIWSNSRFKLSLKVFEERDSLDVLKVKDAAYLERSGSFLLRVDDTLVAAQSVYAKKDWNDRDPYEVSLLDPTLSVIRTVHQKNPKIRSEADVFCERIIEYCQKKKIVPRKLDWDLPEPCTRKQLTEGACLVFGEVDDYLNGRKDLLGYGLKEDLLICSTRKDEINGILNTLNEFHRPFILIGDRPLSNGSVRDFLHYDDREDILYLFRKLMKGEEDITLVIRDIQAFLSYDETHLDRLCRLMKRSRDIRCNVICLCRDARISYRLLNSFGKRILIGSVTAEERNIFFSAVSRYKGDSFFLKEEPIPFVPVKTERFQKGKQVLSSFLDHIPEEISPCRTEKGCLLGYAEEERTALYRRGKLLVCSFDETLLKPYREYSDCFEVRLYDRDLLKKTHEAILWIGPGIFLQRLFIVTEKNDLSSGQGIFLYQGDQIRLRCLHA